MNQNMLRSLVPVKKFNYRGLLNFVGILVSMRHPFSWITLVSARKYIAALFSKPLETPTAKTLHPSTTQQKLFHLGSITS